MSKFNFGFLRAMPILIAFLMLSDIGIYLSSGLSPVLFTFFLIARFIFNRVAVKIVFLVYAFLLGCLFCLNPYGVSLLLITPLIAYTFCFAQRIYLWQPEQFDEGVKAVTFFILAICAIEIASKLSIINLPFYKNFIVNYGDMRFDVLRARSIFGSSLGTAAVAISLAFYWACISPNINLFVVTLLISLLSGSRTSFVLLMIILMFSKMSPLYLGSYRQFLHKSAVGAIAFVALISAINIFPDANLVAIIQRSFHLVADASFTGRGGTSGTTFYLLIEDLPRSLLWGLQGKEWISDSSIVSIAAKSGILSVFFFAGVLFALILKSSMTIKDRIVFAIVCILGASMIGDFFVPPVLFLYVLFFLRLQSTSRSLQRRAMSNSLSVSGKVGCL